SGHRTSGHLKSGHQDTETSGRWPTTSRRRRSGFSDQRLDLASHSLQLVAWLLYFSTSLSQGFGVFVPLLPPHWIPAGIHRILRLWRRPEYHVRDMLSETGFLRRGYGLRKEGLEGETV
uniref:Uncharacterized protein n=1 Tax=Seriola dumerili TaxID=41447 RepID=A0A3B4TWE8_SERDU